MGRTPVYPPFFCINKCAYYLGPKNLPTWPMNFRAGPKSLQSGEGNYTTFFSRLSSSNPSTMNKREIERAGGYVAKCG